MPDTPKARASPHIVKGTSCISPPKKKDAVTIERNNSNMSSRGPGRDSGLQSPRRTIIDTAPHITEQGFITQPTQNKDGPTRQDHNRKPKTWRPWCVCHFSRPCDAFIIAAPNIVQQLEAATASKHDNATTPERYCTERSACRK